jgi:hypothetical protein
MRRPIRNAIKHSDANLNDSLNIVRTCGEYAGGITELLFFVRRMDKGTDALRNLEILIAQLWPELGPH